MAYELKSLARQKIRYNSDDAENAIIYQLVLDGVKCTPTSATISIYRRGNSTALVDGVAMAPSGTFLTYAVDTTTIASWPIETGYRAEITVTYGGETYARTVIFDVVRWLLDLSIGVDQLADIDDNAAKWVHNGDDDLPGPIVAVRGIMQLRIEAKVLEDKKLVENMILDQSHLAICATFYVLALLYLNHGNMEKHEVFMGQFEKMMDTVLNTIRYDEGQDGDEDSEQGGIQEVRLVT